MKKYFMIGLGVVLALSLSLILYGTYLNGRGEFQIAKRMSERSVELQGARVEKRLIRPLFKLNAINLYSKNMADAVALTSGRIIKCVAPKGSVVKKGDTVFIIENEELPLQIKQAEANILSARAERINKENQYKRYQKLKDKGAVSLQQYDNAFAAYEAAVAALEVAEAKLGDLHIQEERQNVIAPLDGQVLMQYRQPGAYVQSGTSLALVGDFTVLNFSTPVNDEIGKHLRVGQQVEIIFNNKTFDKVYDANFAAGNEGSRQKFIASITDITPPVSEPAAMRNVVWQADNRAGLLEPHTYGSVNLQVLQGHDGLAVPLAAMRNDIVFVAKSDNTIEERIISTGGNDGKYIEVLDGLSEGDVVVVSGTEGLKSGIRATVTVQGGK